MFNPRCFFQKITIFSHKSHGFPQKTTIFLPANIINSPFFPENHYLFPWFSSENHHFLGASPRVFPSAVHVPRRLLQVITTEPAAVRTTSAVESASSNSLVLARKTGVGWVLDGFYVRFIFFFKNMVFVFI